MYSYYIVMYRILQTHSISRLHGKLFGHRQKIMKRVSRLFESQFMIIFRKSRRDREFGDYYIPPKLVSRQFKVIWLCHCHLDVDHRQIAIDHTDFDRRTRAKAPRVIITAASYCIRRDQWIGKGERNRNREKTKETRKKLKPENWNQSWSIVSVAIEKRKPS